MSLPDDVGNYQQVDLFDSEGINQRNIELRGLLVRTIGRFNGGVRVLAIHRCNRITLLLLVDRTCVNVETKVLHISLRLSDIDPDVRWVVEEEEPADTVPEDHQAEDAVVPEEDHHTEDQPHRDVPTTERLAWRSTGANDPARPGNMESALFNR